MNHHGTSNGAEGVRRIGKSSDPDHPFHPYDDVDSDDAAIEALLDSSSGSTPESTQSEELGHEHDPMYPYHDAFPPPVKPVRSPAAAPREPVACVQLELPEYQFSELKRLHNQLAAAKASNIGSVNSQVIASVDAPSNECVGERNASVVGRSASIRDSSTTALKIPSSPVQSTELCEPAADELSPIREQLASLAAHGTAHDRPPPTHNVLSNDSKSPAPLRLSACTLLSILLNVAAFSAAVAIGAKQLWDD
eukprot:6210359-Pleurochrysis_carterae.AAC.1